MANATSTTAAKIPQEIIASRETSGPRPRLAAALQVREEESVAPFSVTTTHHITRRFASGYCLFGTSGGQDPEFISPISAAPFETISEPSLSPVNEGERTPVLIQAVLHTKATRQVRVSKDQFSSTSPVDIVMPYNPDVMYRDHEETFGYPIFGSRLSTNQFGFDAFGIAPKFFEFGAARRTTWV